MKERIDLLLKRDGMDRTINWALRTVDQYFIATEDPYRYSSNYKLGFLREIECLIEWLESQDRLLVIQTSLWWMRLEALRAIYESKDCQK